MKETIISRATMITIQDNETESYAQALLTRTDEYQDILT